MFRGHVSHPLGKGAAARISGFSYYWTGVSWNHNVPMKALSHAEYTAWMFVVFGSSHAYDP